MSTTPQLRRFVIAVALAAGGMAVSLPSPSTDTAPELFLILLGLTALAGMYPISFAGSGIRLTMAHPLILGTLALLGPRPAVWAAVAAVLGASVVRQGLRRPIRLAFNLAEMTVSTSAAAWVFLAVGRTGESVIEFVLPLLAATAVFFAVNTGLVAGVVSIERGEPFGDVWRRSFGWTTPAYFAAVTISLGLILLLTELGSWALGLALPPCWLLAAFYRLHERALAEKQTKIRQVEALNEELMAALAQVRTLEGVLPICVHCKSIRDDNDTWRRLEAYVESHSDATFTHGLCNHCREEHYDKSPTPV